MTKTTLGGEKTGPNPTDGARKGRNARSSPKALVPIGLAHDGANRNDHRLLKGSHCTTKVAWSRFCPGSTTFVVELAMPSSKVTRKGQITIPQEYREALGIREGDCVRVILQDDALVVRRTVPWSGLAGSLHHLAPLIPDDEPGLKALVSDAWGEGEQAPALDEGGV
ncbi:MAG: AbrB/MazE/SpoVT family DNA-binding domain-containing protein [Actinobacteria bacterium]|nr:AbrB/MazE/SpoVT family DNA-binding domain-containing protein [Actinomycetota bacterium]